MFKGFWNFIKNKFGGKKTVCVHEHVGPCPLISEKEREKIREIIKTKKLNHIVILPDGDRRWAAKHGLNPMDGHTIAFTKVAPTILEELLRFGVPTVTMSAMSTNNFKKRSSEEIKNLLETINFLLLYMIRIAPKYELKIVHLGNREGLPPYLQQSLDKAERETSMFTRHVFNFGINYGGRDEICRAVNKILKQKNQHDQITEEEFAQYLDTANQHYPNPDLVINTGIENRWSGFAVWQCVFSELYSVNKNFPAYDCCDIKKAIFDFAKRVRRFGGNV